MKKFILSGACMFDRVELNVQPPQIYNNLLEAREAMLGSIMLDLEEMDYRVENESNGTIMFKRISGNCNLGGATTRSAWIDMEDFSAAYEIKEVEI